MFEPAKDYRRVISTSCRSSLSLLLLLTLLVCLSLVPAFGAASSVDFQSNIKALFETNCAICHSEKTKTSGFSVSSLESVVEGGNKLGRAVVPGHPEESPLLKVLKGELTPQMPLGKSLSPDEINRVEEWVSNLKAEDVTGVDAGEWRWPFEKPVKHEPPVVKNKAWVRNAIDAFVLSKLEKEGLSPAPPAPKRTLARRIHLDLVGMPPGPEELNAFLEDESPAAYETLVNRLLEDPRYGERWGRHWLDVVRYGETSGLEGDGAIGNAWRYRDWVIQAFNDDMPYDRFVLLQLAGGDEHSQLKGNYVPDPQGYIPTGFLRLAPWDRSNLVADDVRQNYLAEVTTATGSIFLGLTMGCARCHDHKYDPIPQKDFYRLQAFFNAIQVDHRRGGVKKPSVPYKDKAFAAKAGQKIKEYEERLKDGPEKRELDELEEQLLQKMKTLMAERAKGKELTNKDLRLEIKHESQTIFTPGEQAQHMDLLAAADRTGDPPEKKVLEAYEEKLLSKLKEAYARDQANPMARFEALKVEDVRREARAKYSAESFFSEEEKSYHATLSGKLDVFRRRLGRWKPEVLGVGNVPGPPSGPALPKTHVLTRGDYRQPAEPVEPGFPSAITGGFEAAEIETDRYRQFPTRGLRMTLAKWIANPENPLTARVMVNRVWQYHFGRGIVRTTSNFGKNGQRPSHPELLDRLAVEFVERDWSVKAIHRRILFSSTYRQSSENPAHNGNSVDPDNKLLWRFNRRRLEAEAIRDSILFVSGRLNPAMRGPSVFPPLPDDLADFARYGRTGGLMWEPNETEEEARRRSVYIFQRRSLPLPIMASFDAKPFSESVPQRSFTTTPLQALNMMNGYLVHEESEHLANRIGNEAGDDRSEQVKRAFEIVLSRPPKAEETGQFTRFDGSLAAICRVLLTSNEFLYVE